LGKGYNIIDFWCAKVVEPIKYYIHQWLLEHDNISTTSTILNILSSYYWTQCNS
jgi:hypothetical protein